MFQIARRRLGGVGGQIEHPSRGKHQRRQNQPDHRDKRGVLHDRQARFLRGELMLKELGNIGLFVNLKAEH